MIHVEIRQDHIENGKARKCALCPVALALRDVLDSLNLSEVLVSVIGSHANLYLKGGKPWASIALPDPVREFVHKVDMNRPVEPLKFSIVDRSQVLGEIRHRHTFGYIDPFTA